MRVSLILVALALLAAAPVLAQPAAVRFVYYDVQGADFNALLGALNARGRHHGRADWKLGYRYQSRAGAGSCAVSAFSTELELVMTLPRWTPPANAQPGLAARWDRYLAALRGHEEGHLEHGRDAERELKALAAGLSAPDCNALDAALRQRFSKLIADYQARDRDYDARTGHGKTQGAWFQ